MFYEVKNLLTSIVVAAFEMQILAKDAELIKRLKQKMEGRCLIEYGYIIKILTDSYRISEPVVEEDGCRVEIRFSAITFKRTTLCHSAEKDDIIDFLVTDVNEHIIKGQLGPAIVVIPEARILGTCWTFKKEENAFVDNKTKYRIEKDTKLRCKVIEVHIDMSTAAANRRLPNEDRGVAGGGGTRPHRMTPTCK